MKKFVLIVLSVVMLFTVVGCSRNDTEDKVGIRGEITEIVLDDKGEAAAIMVEGKVEPDTVYDKARVGIREDTEIYEKVAMKKLGVESIKEGLKVEVIFSGPVAESYPVQGTAKVIRIIE